MESQNFSASKTTVECYKIRHKSGMYWADITIDAGEKGGRIMIASDFGTWQNYWSSPGDSFKQFLMSLNMEYVADKFGADRHFDQAATLCGYRARILEIRKQEGLTAEHARKLFDQCKGLEDYTHENEFCMELRGSHELMRFFDHCPDLSRDTTPGFKRFWKSVWPAFLDMLKEELKTIS